MLMRIGVVANTDQGSPAVAEVLVRQAREAEALGLATIWFSNIFGFDAMTAAAVCGRETTRIELGTAVVPTYTRHPWAMAQQGASTNAALQRRFTLGIGPSHKAVVERIWGLSCANALSHTREYLEVLGPLLRNGTVDFSGEIFRVRAALDVHDGLPVSILLAALRPRMLELAGNLADGTITWLAGLRSIRENIAPRVRESAANVGRSKPRIVVGLPVLVTDHPAAARLAAAAQFASYEKMPAYRAMLDLEGVESVGDVAIVGDEDAVGGQLERLSEAGATDFFASVIRQPSLAPDASDRTLELLGRLSSDVAPSVRP